jgi:hypothetical protein
MAELRPEAALGHGDARPGAPAGKADGLRVHASSTVRRDSLFEGGFAPNPRDHAPTMGQNQCKADAGAGPAKHGLLGRPERVAPGLSHCLRGDESGIEIEPSRTRPYTSPGEALDAVPGPATPSLPLVATGRGNARSNRREFLSIKPPVAPPP